MRDPLRGLSADTCFVVPVRQVESRSRTQSSSVDSSSDSSSSDGDDDVTDSDDEPPPPPPPPPPGKPDAARRRSESSAEEKQPPAKKNRWNSVSQLSASSLVSANLTLFWFRLWVKPKHARVVGFIASRASGCASSVVYCRWDVQATEGDADEKDEDAKQEEKSQDKEEESTTHKETTTESEKIEKPKGMAVVHVYCLHTGCIWAKRTMKNW